MKILGMEINIRKEILITLIIVITVIAAAIGYKIMSGSGEIIIEANSTHINEIKNDTEIAAIQATSEKEADEIKVYITGCVKNPGIITLERGAMIIEALDAAGGVTDEADIENINLVYKLNYNLMLNIRSKNASEQSANDSRAGKGVLINEGSGLEEDIITDGGSDTASSKDKININTASSKELQTLPGIGEKTAEDILAYRDKNGVFDTIEDIMKIPGIKEGRFANIKEMITID